MLATASPAATAMDKMRPRPNAGVAVPAKLICAVVFITGSRRLPPRWERGALGLHVAGEIRRETMSLNSASSIGHIPSRRCGRYIIVATIDVVAVPDMPAYRNAM